MSVGDDVHGVPLNQLPFSEERDTASFYFLSKEKFLGREFERGAFLWKAPLS
jgi:hypothetical protein